MAERLLLTFGKFSGMDQSASQLDTPLHATHDAQNVEVRGGVLYTCNNDALAYDVGKGPICTLIDRVEAGEENRPLSRLYAATDDGIYRRKDDGTWEDAQVFAGQQSGRYDVCNYSVGEVYYTVFANGVDQMGVWNGHGQAEQLGPDTRFLSVCLHYERMWGTGNRNNHQRVWYSNAYTANDWYGKGSGSVDVYSPNTARTIAVRSYYNELVVFKDREIFRIYGTYPGEFGIAKVMGDYGPVNPQSIVSCMDRVYYMSERDGICYYDGLRTRPLMDEKLREFFMNPQLNLENCCGIAKGGKLYFALDEDGDGINDCAIQYDTIRKSYLLYRGIQANCFLLREDEILYGSNDGRIYRLLSAEEGIRRRAYWRTPRQDLGAKYVKKCATVLYAHAQGEGELRIIADFGERVREKKMQLTEALTPIRVAIPALGRTVQFTFENVEGSHFILHSPQIALEVDEDWR
ncbi:hypothetical protein LJC20_03700 [Eubacteriales bacterium OttesenSCG-928-M02]|nr:hypothetical protein [Eubacteriales bacterium OttesenSCG-928-M02]